MLFMTARSEAVEEYLLMTRRYASAKGSQMYIDKMDEAAKKRDKAISNAQSIAKREIREKCVSPFTIRRSAAQRVSSFMARVMPT